jgi:hypothetical protein
MTETAAPDTIEELVDQAKEARYHTVLEMWQKVIEAAGTGDNRRITPQWATRIAGSYFEISYRDLPAFRDEYFEKIAELLATLVEETADDDEALQATSPEEDLERNAHHYLNLLVTWQQQILTWELQWKPTLPDAAIQLAAIGETMRLFFGDNGLTGLLDVIGFQFTDDHREMLAEILEQTQKDLIDA